MRVARAVTRRPIVTVAVVGALALIGIALASRLEPSSSTDSLVGRSSAAASATADLHRQFGDEAVVVLVKGDLERTVLTSDLNRLIAFEGCLSGNVPAQGLAQLPHVCTQIKELHPAKVVYGPGTFINTAANEITQGFAQQEQAVVDQCTAAGEAARRAAAKQGLPPARQNQLAQAPCQIAESNYYSQTIRTALSYGLTGIPAVNNPQFVYQLVFDTQLGHGQPKSRFASLFPSNQAALVQIRMRPNLTDAQRRQAIAYFRTAATEPRFKLTNGQRYYVSGVPVVVDGLATAVQHAIVVLLGAALVIMAATLMVAFRTRRRVRLLPLAIALAAAAITYGLLSLAGLSLTMASIAALPVLIGLAVDYAIQLQARFDESRAQGEAPVGAARLAARAGAPTIAGAALATAAGFLVLLLSPVPMVHGFAVLVIVGIVVALACALTAGLATLSRFSIGKPRPEDLPPALPAVRARLTRLRDAIVLGRARGLFETARGVLALVVAAIAWVAIAVAANPLWLRLLMLALLVLTLTLVWFAWEGRRRFALAVRRYWRKSVGAAIENPQRVLAIGLTVAVIGWIADTQTALVSDIAQLVPQNLGALQDAKRLEQATGVSGEIDVMVRGRDITSPAVINWMTSFQQRILARHGYRYGSSCRQAHKPPELCPALSLTDLFQTPPTQAAQVRSLLAAVPAYFSQAVITPDRRTATMAFGIRLMPLERQEQVVSDIQRSLKPPAGVTARVAGLPVLAADADAKLSSEPRRLLTLVAGLAAVFLVLLAVRRRLSLALVPLIPIAFATGWSSLVLFLLRIPLNPMSVTLGALVIAITTEFSVLLSSRYREERDAGAGPERALELAYSSTGAAVLASAATAIAGFAALMASDIRMLRDFGAATVCDLTVSLVGVLVVLPAALIWAERHGRFELRDLDPRRLARAYWRAVGPLPAHAAAAVRRAAPSGRVFAPRRPRARLRPRFAAPLGLRRVRRGSGRA